MSKVSKSTKSGSIGLDQDRQWKIESAMGTILRYNDLMKDKSLMQDVQKRAQDQLNTVNTNLKLGGAVKKASPKKAMPSKKSSSKQTSKKK